MKKYLLFVLFCTSLPPSFSQSISLFGNISQINNYHNAIGIQYFNYNYGNCYRYNQYKNELRADIHKKIDGIQNLYSSVSGGSYVGFNVFILSDQYASRDTAIFSDTTLIIDRDNSILPLASTMDADSNFHFVGYSGWTDSFTYHTYNKLLYYTMPGATSYYSQLLWPYDTIHFPVHQPTGLFTSYKILEDLRDGTPLPGFVRIFPTPDNQILLVQSKARPVTGDSAIEFIKIDGSTHLTFDTIINFPESFTDSTFGYLRELRIDTIHNNIYISGVHGTEFNFGPPHNGNMLSYEVFVMKFDANGHFLQKRSFTNDTPYADSVNGYLSVIRNGFSVDRLGTDSSVLHLINSSGDTIKNIYFPIRFKHDIIYTSDHKYIQIDIPVYFDTMGYLKSDLEVNVLDTIGRLMKHFREPIYLGLWFDTYMPVADPIYAAMDQYENIHFYANYLETNGSHCGQFIGKGGVFNLHYINQVNGTVTDSLQGVGSMQLELLLNGQSYFTQTDSNGFYNFAPADTGHGIIILHPDSNPQYENTGNDTIPIILSDTIANPIVNYALRSRATSIFNHSKIKTSLYPNPFNAYTTLSFQYDKPTTLSILSVEGKSLQQYSSSQKNYLIYKKEMASGMYLYELRDKETNELLSNGKIIIE